MEVGTGLFQADLAKMVEVSQMTIGNQFLTFASVEVNIWLSDRRLLAGADSGSGHRGGELLNPIACVIPEIETLQSQSLFQMGINIVTFHLLPNLSQYTPASTEEAVLR